MKELTIDYDTYHLELKESYNSGLRDGASEGEFVYQKLVKHLEICPRTGKYLVRANLEPLLNDISEICEKHSANTVPSIDSLRIKRGKGFKFIS